MAAAHRNSQQLGLSAPNLNKIRLIKIPARTGVWFLRPPPLAEELTATGEGESILFLGWGPWLVVHIPSGWPHTNACVAVLWEFGRRRKRGRGKRRGEKENKHEVGKGQWCWGEILRNLEMGNGHGSGQNPQRINKKYSKSERGKTHSVYSSEG